jgi:hypothetical protein
MIETQEQWEAGIGKLTSQGGGVMRLHVLSPRDVVLKVAAAHNGDHEAYAIINALSYFTDSVVARAATPEPHSCLLCDRPFDLVEPGMTLCLTVPDTTDATVAAGFGVCARCSWTTPKADMRRRVCEGLRVLWPGIRAIDISATAGHA